RRPVDELRRKLDILAEHGAAVGRDTAQIERTLYLAVLIRDEPAEARRIYEAAAAHNETGEVQVARAWCGPPHLIAELLQPYIAIGFTHFIFDLPSPFDIETIERLIGEVRPLLTA